MAALVLIVLLLALAGVLLAGLAALPLVLILAAVGLGIWFLVRGTTPARH